MSGLWGHTGNGPWPFPLPRMKVSEALRKVSSKVLEALRRERQLLARGGRAGAMGAQHQGGADVGHTVNALCPVFPSLPPNIQFATGTSGGPVSEASLGTVYKAQESLFPVLLPIQTSPSPTLVQKLVVLA